VLRIFSNAKKALTTGMAADTLVRRLLFLSHNGKLSSSDKCHGKILKNPPAARAN